MNSYVLSFQEIDKAKLSMVGGKGANLGELSKAHGILVVVGVENATKLIKDGKRIRVHGTEGYVEIL